MLKIFIEIIVQFFHDIMFFFRFLCLAFFFGLIGFAQILLACLALYCVFGQAKKFLCLWLCFEGEGGLISSYKFIFLSAHFILA